MDKLTVIKIKYDDGTYSDEIPVSVLSENVEWDSTHTLVDVLGSIDVDVTGTIQDQISQLFNEKVSATQLQNYVASQLNEDVSTWLNTNVNPVGSAVVVDSSLTISGAAADAKKVGDEVNSIKSAFDDLNTFVNDRIRPINWLRNPAKIFPKTNINTTTGEKSPNSSYTLYVMPYNGETVFINRVTDNLRKVLLCSDVDADNVLGFAADDGLTKWPSYYTSTISGAQYIAVVVKKTFEETAIIAEKSEYLKMSDGYKWALDKDVYIKDVDSLQTETDAQRDDIDELETNKLAVPLDEFDLPTFGNPGQVLASNGDGTTQWTDAGAPTQKQIDDSVNAWLVDNPQAITQVQDGSLTQAKFTNLLKTQTLKTYLTPEMFGAVGDDVHDDAPNINNMLLSAALSGDRVGIVRLTNNKTYRIKSTIYVPVWVDFGGMGFLSVIHVDETLEGPAFVFQNGYAGCYVHDFKVIGGKESFYCFCIREPSCLFERIKVNNYFGEGVYLAPPEEGINSQSAWMTTLRNFSFSGHIYGKSGDTTPIPSQKTGIYINSSGGNILLDNCNITQCSTGIHIKSGIGIYIKNSNISNCVKTINGATQYSGVSMAQLVYAEGGKAIDIADCYLEHADAIIVIDGAIRTALRNSYIDPIRGGSAGTSIHLDSGVGFSFTDNYLKDSSNSGVGISISNSFTGHVNVSNNRLEIVTPYAGNTTNLVYVNNDIN